MDTEKFSTLIENGVNKVTNRQRGILMKRQNNGAK